MSPRSFTTEERSRIDSSLRGGAALLMRRMRIRNITVEDLAREAGIAKGSFYSFYRSREALLWTVIKAEEQAMVERLADLGREEGERQALIKRAFTEVMLDRDGLLFQLSPQDISSLTQKLPAEVLAGDKANGNTLLTGLLASFGLAQDQGTVSILQSMVHTLGFVASSENELAAEAAPELLELLVDAFAARLSQSTVH